MATRETRRRAKVLGLFAGIEVPVQIRFTRSCWACWLVLGLLVCIAYFTYSSLVDIILYHNLIPLKVHIFFKTGSLHLLILNDNVKFFGLVHLISLENA